jgi:uncharacterized membrane protein
MRRASILLIIALLLGACAEKPPYPEAPVSGEVIRLGIPENQGPVFYSFSHGGKRIDFFLVKVGGRVESYFDACRKCYPKKLGYRPDGEKVLCRACGMRFGLDELRGGMGSCHPIALTGRLLGDAYVIDKEEIIKGAAYF